MSAAGRRALLSSAAIAASLYFDFTQMSSLPAANFSYVGASLRTIIDATGALTSAPNQALLNNATLSTQSVTVTPAWNYMLSFFGTGSITLSGAATGTLSGTGASNQVYLKITAPSAGSLTLSVSGSVTAAVLSAVTYETTPRPGDQVITTSAQFYGPAFDYSQSSIGAPLGLRIEESRTNVVLYDRALTNASWVAGATMTVAQSQTGIDGVANSAALLTGGAASLTNTLLQSITLASSARYQTAYVKRVTGTGTVNMTQDGGTTWTAISGAINSSTWTRVSIPTQTIANPSVGFQIVTSGDAIAVDLVQNENGAFATSGIITAGSSVTRAADVVGIVGNALNALKVTPGTAIVETGAISGYAGYARIIGGGSTGTGLLAINGNTSQLNTYEGVILTTTYGGGINVSTAQSFRSGVSWSASGRSLVGNGGSVASDTHNIIHDTSSCLGNYGGAYAFLDGHVTKLALYNKALPPSALQAKTVLGASLH